MTYYFYQQDSERCGPFTKEELKDKRLLKTTHVWKEGMENWAEAQTLDELKEILVSEPPPFIVHSKEELAANVNPDTQIANNKEFLQQKNDTKEQVQTSTIHKNIEDQRKNIEEFDINKLKYDPAYKKEIGITITGVGLLVFSNILLFSDALAEMETLSLALINLAYRIFVTFFIVGVAERQNRNQTGWGVLAFGLPTLALIIIGLLRKKIKDGPYKWYKKNGQMSHFITYKNGKREGPFEWYYDNGQISARGTFRNDKMYGLFERFNPEGGLTYSTFID